MLCTLIQYSSNLQKKDPWWGGPPDPEGDPAVDGDHVRQVICTGGEQLACDYARDKHSAASASDTSPN